MSPDPSLAPQSDVPMVTRKRGSYSFTAQADCLGKTSDNEVFAAWRDPPALTDDKGRGFIFPNVVLQPGDQITLTAPICPAFIDKTKGESVTAATITYLRANTSPGGKEALKWVIIGRVPGADNNVKESVPATSKEASVKPDPIVAQDVDKKNERSLLWLILALVIVGVILILFFRRRR